MRSQRVKRVLDVVFCLLAVPLLVPVVALLVVAVKLDSRGPAFFAGNRIGRDGHPFRIVKLRSMATGRSGPAITRAGDRRITRVGRLLRATKLDELPQVLNVLRGEMSIVGPRPEDPRYVAVYTPAQREVLRVRPGMTSSALMRFGNEQAYIERAAPADLDRFYVEELMPQKLSIELAYLRDWTLRKDLAIIARTATRMLS